MGKVAGADDCDPLAQRPPREMLEVAVRDGDAASHFSIGAGAAVTLRLAGT